MSNETTIETGVRAMLSSVCREVTDMAGLAVVRGSVGIGKTYALTGIAQELENKGVSVVMLTATETIAGQNNAFLRSILMQRLTDTTSSVDAEEAVWEMLAGRPFLSGGRKSLFIVDESQKLAGRVLETIRGLWDRGDNARLGMRNSRGFGCILVGNPTFMSKGGVQRTASFAPLIDRLTHNISLPRPNREECLAYASTLYSEEALVLELAELGHTRGNLRSMATASRSASVRAGDNSVTLELLRLTIKMMGGK